MSQDGQTPVLASGRGIRLTNLHKSYRAVQAVAGVDLAIEPGETVALGAWPSSPDRRLVGADRKAGSGIARLVKLIPSYWLVQAALGGKGWTAEGWVVIGVWTVGPALLGGKV